MGRYSLVVDDEVRDIRYSRHTDSSWNIFIGDELVGIAFNHHNHWNLVCVPAHAHMYKGLATRYHCAMYAAAQRGYIPWDAL